jgi:hypothetical protein
MEISSPSGRRQGHSFYPLVNIGRYLGTLKVPRYLTIYSCPRTLFPEREEVRGQECPAGKTIRALLGATLEPFVFQGSSQ